MNHVPREGKPGQGWNPDTSGPWRLVVVLPVWPKRSILPVSEPKNNKLRSSLKLKPECQYLEVAVLIGSPARGALNFVGVSISVGPD